MDLLEATDRYYGLTRILALANSSANTVLPLMKYLLRRDVVRLDMDLYRFYLSPKGRTVLMHYRAIKDTLEVPEPLSREYYKNLEWVNKRRRNNE